MADPGRSADRWQQLSRLALNAPHITAEQTASAIHAEHGISSIALTADLRALLRRGEDLKIRPPAANTVIVDGAEYSLRVASPSGQLTFRTDGPQDVRASSVPVIRWIADVRKQLENVPLATAT